ncbi:hypothetical protein TNIN_493651 [Trichonephila inaurata madagascariensis]|uniref:Uncharacterized protein n=1 Tax=Trichonephila inaurata madagascariensis TaxID=2747483 RepID=A0A8X6WUA4_9ARAC|nr:hypothetical protein TNIN_493651 [Trichonephila inaurata madagascariensis]
MSSRPKKKLPFMHLFVISTKNSLNRKEGRWDKTVTVEENCSKIKYNKLANNPTKKMKLVRRQLDFQFSESKNSTHSFEVPDIDTDDDPENLNDKD